MFDFDIFDSAGNWLKRIQTSDEAAIALNTPEGGSAKPHAEASNETEGS